MIRGAITAVLFFVGILVQAQNPGETLKKADMMLIDADYSGVITLVDRSLPGLKDNAVAIQLETKKAEALTRLGQLESAEKLLNASLAKANNDPFLVAVVQTSQAALYLNQGRNDLAEETTQSALDGFLTAKRENSLEAAQAISNLGIIYLNAGQYTQAEEQLQMALSMRQKQLDKNHELIAASYNDLGLVNVSLNEDKALQYYEAALAIYKALHGEDHPKIAIANTNIGLVYRKMELYGDAENDFESALSIWEKVYPQAHPSKGFVLLNLGLTYANTDKAAALGYYDKALWMYKQSYGDKHPEIARVYNAMGALHLSENRYEDALKSYQSGIKSNIREFNSDDVEINPALEEFYEGSVLLYSLLGKAQAYEARYLGRTISNKDLYASLDLLKLCDNLIDLLRQRISNENDKISLGVIAHEVYADGVRVAQTAMQNSFKKKNYREQAFYFAEKSKSAALLDAISDVHAKSFAGIPPELLEREKQIKSELALCTQKLAQKPSAEEEQKLREAAFNLSRAYEDFTQQLETDYPEYYNLKFNAASPSSAELQSLMDDHTAVLSYFIDDKINHLYIFLITKKKFTLIDRQIPADFDKFITGLRNGLFYNEPSVYERAAETLSFDLVPNSIHSSVRDLVIIPTGRLSIVPFETLFSKSPYLLHKVLTEDSRGNAPYLVKNYSIRYELSASLILQKAKIRPSTDISILLCAPISFAAKDKLDELPGTESEVKEISQLFASKNLKNATFMRQQADEALTKSGRLKDYSFLHFATHGIVDERNPELSRIFLQSNSDKEDGNLFTGEIYNLELNANLVTLSACETGLGKISKGEGVIGLSRALVYAGARNLMVSFWSVADASTADLMTDFYRQMLEHSEATYSENLRQAKLGLIKSDKYNSPYYWAPFVLIGF
jgi:CHAT domain-containing protein/Tfp pilus assembly protein PilF